LALELSWKSLDYVAGWFMKAADYATVTNADAAFVSHQLHLPRRAGSCVVAARFQTDSQDSFAHTSFKWANLASHNAGVTVAIVGLESDASNARQLYFGSRRWQRGCQGSQTSAYLVSGPDLIVEKVSRTSSDRAPMLFGNKPTDGGNFFFITIAAALWQLIQRLEQYLRPYYGSAEFIRGILRYCLWIRRRSCARVSGYRDRKPH
jgi:hypothetical protein